MSEQLEFTVDQAADVEDGLSFGAWVESLSSLNSGRVDVADASGGTSDPCPAAAQGLEGVQPERPPVATGQPDVRRSELLSRVEQPLHSLHRLMRMCQHDSGAPLVDAAADGDHVAVLEGLTEPLSGVSPNRWRRVVEGVAHVVIDEQVVHHGLLLVDEKTLRLLTLCPWLRDLTAARSQHDEEPCPRPIDLDAHDVDVPRAQWLRSLSPPVTEPRDDVDRAEEASAL